MSEEPEASAESVEAAASPQRIAELVQRFGARPDPTRPRARFPLKDCVAHVMPEHGAPFEVEVLDVGFLGVGLLVRQELAVGACFVLQLPPPHAGMLPCQVRHRTELEGDLAHIGASFEVGAR